MDYRIEIVSTSGQLREFIKFPDTLYASCPQYVPALHADQKRSLTKAAPLEYCEHRLWLLRDGNGKVAGRIHGMINPRYNELYGRRRARFGWFDVVNDLEAARMLLSTAEQWAKERGMTEIHGPLYYNTGGKQGMLVEGFENVPPVNCYYNYPYYNDLLTALGYGKELDWLQYRVEVPSELPEKVVRLSDRLKEKFGLRSTSIEEMTKDKATVHRFFKDYNDSFAGNVENFIPFTDAEIAEEAKENISHIKDKYSVVLEDPEGEMAIFGLSVPFLSYAFQKCKGRLFPFGWYHILHALNHQHEVTDLLVIGATPKWQSSGVTSIVHTEMFARYIPLGVKWCVTNPQIETNGAAVNAWARYGAQLYMRRRCYIKTLK